MSGPDKGSDSGQTPNDPKQKKARNGQMETYSCARCRKLKKKCPRQLPECSNCLKAREPCNYPGRAPRRTKKELRDAIMKGEVLPSMRRKHRKIEKELKTADLRHLESVDDRPVNQVMGGSMPPLGAYRGGEQHYNNGPPISGIDGNDSINRGKAQSVGSYQILPPQRKSKLVLDQNPKFVHSQSSALKTNEYPVPIMSPHIANQVYPEGVSSLISALNTMNDNVSANTPIALSYLQLQKLHQEQQQIQQQQIQQQQQHQHLVQQHLQHVRADATSILPPVTSQTVYTPIPGPRTSQIPFGFTHGYTASAPPPLMQPYSMPTSPFESREKQQQFDNIQYHPVYKIPPIAARQSPIDEIIGIENGSISIDASSITREVVNARMKGPHSTSWVNEDGSPKPIKKSLLEKFVSAYFEHNHRLFPMVDKVTFLKKLATINSFESIEMLAVNNPELPKTFIFEIYMIMAIGCTTLQRAGKLTTDEGHLYEHLAYLAMRNFRDILHQQDITTLRCLILLGIYSFFEPKGVSSWTISGIAMRLAIELGLNRPLTAKEMGDMSAVEVESRYRVFWSAYCFERVVATSLGRVSAIDDEDIGIPLPRALYDSEKEDIEVTNLIISLRKMGGKIYKEVHSLSAGRKDITMEQKQLIIQKLRKELDDIYEEECEKRRLKEKSRSSKRFEKSKESDSDRGVTEEDVKSGNENLIGLLASDDVSMAEHGQSIDNTLESTPLPTTIPTTIVNDSVDQNSTLENIPISATSKDQIETIITKPTANIMNDQTDSDTLPKVDNKPISNNEEGPKSLKEGHSEQNPSENISPEDVTLTKTDNSENKESSLRSNSNISFHISNVWLEMRYTQLQILLYRPSALIPKPPIESLTVLGEFCLAAWRHTYTLYKEKLLPLNWITLFRTLTICNTILYCLCQWSIDLVASTIEIQQCVEILQHFGEKWVFAMKCADVFQNISNTIVEISLSQGQDPNIDKLTRELFGASNAYLEILNENNVDVSWEDRFR